MSDNFSNSQVVRKRVVPTRGGVVAAQHKRAAEVGAAILEAGGDAIDAAVATSFAIGVVEPWMSGVAAGGCMVLWRAAEGKAYVVDYGMRSPGSLNPSAYPIVGGEAPDLFAWPRVKDDRNVQGATAVAVPGLVAGMGLAHERFGRLPWRDLVAPAAQLAKEGMLLDWFGGLQIASNARFLALDKDAAALFLEEGKWAPISGWTALTEKRLEQDGLASTLEAISREGANAVYGGDVGAAIAKDVQAKGGCLAVSDLEAYRAHFAEPIEVPYHGGRIFAAPGMTGGPALASSLKKLSETANPSYVDYARVLEQAWRERLQASGDRESCTTHFSVADRHGNLCAATQTLLSIFGSRVVSPSTGVLLNNGIMWFDPQPGKPNSLAPDKRCLGNYCPVIGETPKGERFALGASGGRKIVGTVLQISAFLIDDGASLEEAFHRPRIDMSGMDQVLADVSLPPNELKKLEAAFPVTLARRLPFPYHFAVPAGVLRTGNQNMGCTETLSPWGDAVAEKNSNGQ
ncbi:MAG: gamma-glutamyltransferase [Betaproteobacteria bacterium]|nr:MAG: gamma-glutamyltransferase [Betaproteobacteria bacterium]